MFSFDDEAITLFYVSIKGGGPSTDANRDNKETAFFWRLFVQRLSESPNLPKISLSSFLNKQTFAIPRQSFTGTHLHQFRLEETGNLFIDIIQQAWNFVPRQIPLTVVSYDAQHWLDLIDVVLCLGFVRNILANHAMRPITHLLLAFPI